MADVGLETVGIGRQGQGGRAGPGQGSWAGFGLAKGCRNIQNFCFIVEYLMPHFSWAYSEISRILIHPFTNFHIPILK